MAVQNHFCGKTRSFPVSQRRVEGHISTGCALVFQRVYALSRKTTGITFCLSVRGDLAVLTWEKQASGQRQMSTLIYSNFDGLNEKQVCFLLLDENNGYEFPSRRYSNHVTSQPGRILPPDTWRNLVSVSKYFP